MSSFALKIELIEECIFLIINILFFIFMKRITLSKSAMRRFKQGDFVSFLALLIEATTSMENENNKFLVDDLKLKRAELLDAIANYSTKSITQQIYSYCKLLRTCRMGIRYAYSTCMLKSEDEVYQTALKVKEIVEKYPLRKAKTTYTMISSIENLNKELKALGNKALDLVGIKQFVADLDTYDVQLIKIYDNRTNERLRIQKLKDEKLKNALESVCNLFEYLNAYNFVEKGKYDEFIDKVNDIYKQSKYLIKEDSSNQEVVSNEPNEVENPVTDNNG